MDTMSPEEKSNVARGYKSTISNPNTSEEAKQHAREALEKLGDTSFNQGEKDPNRVAGGLKAAMHNPGISEEGKKEAERKLKEMEK